MRKLVYLVVLWAFSLGSIFAEFIPRTASDPDFVWLGKHRGYYLVSSNSGRWWSWGLGRAPVEEPRVFSHGSGNDVIIIPFEMNQRVAFAPIYIYTIRPEAEQKRRLATLFQGVTSQADVEQIFGRPAVRGRTRGYQVWYYEIEVYNPFEEFPGRDR